MRRVPSLLICVASIVGCTEDGSPEAESTTMTPTEQTPVTREPPSGRVPCAELFAERVDTDTAIEVGENDGCVDAGGQAVYIANASSRCYDGRTLYWNAEGWGYSGTTWHRHLQGVTRPPESETSACETRR